jgi:hypothetical protein
MSIDEESSEIKFENRYRFTMNELDSNDPDHKLFKEYYGMQSDCQIAFLNLNKYSIDIHRLINISVYVSLSFTSHNIKFIVNQMKPAKRKSLINEMRKTFEYYMSQIEEGITS